MQLSRTLWKGRKRELNGHGACAPEENMNPVTKNDELIERTIEFHGHWCPGLAIGIRAARWALGEMGKSPDEEIVAVVETDMCGVDAIQCLVGCTFGKGNLIHRDYGKNAFTFYRRRDGKAARLVTRENFKGEAGRRLSDLHRKMREEGLTEAEKKQLEEARQEVSRWILECPVEELFHVKEPAGPPPQRARIMASQVCEVCGEQVMETRIRRFDGKFLCIPCFEAVETR